LTGNQHLLIPYDRLFKEFKDGGYPPEILEKVYYKNAIRILNLDIDESAFKTT